MIAWWQAVGFMHGVMNTDNMSILGLTLDYGPFGFMEAFDPRHICNHTDQQGRYAYSMQPQIGDWNCYALGQALLPLIGDVDEAKDALAVYRPAFAGKMDALLHAKLGLATTQDEDGKLFDDMFGIMAASHVDFTLFFRRLGRLAHRRAGVGGSRCATCSSTAPHSTNGQYNIAPGCCRKTVTICNDALQCTRSNPKYVLRNYLAQQAIEKAQIKDFSEVQKLLAVLEHPFDEQPENEQYAALPPDWASELEVSCSS